MIITFFGHSDFIPMKKYKERVMEVLVKYENERVDFLLGGQGNFDGFAWECCKEYKKINPNARLLYVSPCKGEQLDKQIAGLKEAYDGLIYSPFCYLPLNDAIQKRNEWMINIAKLAIIYVDRHYGDAYRLFEYAQSKIGFVNLYERSLWRKTLDSR